MSKPWLTAAIAAISITFASPVFAGVILITQQKAIAGSVTPGDAPGFPVTLSLPGAYRFDTNLTVPLDRNGIEVKSPYVDIDMAGFRLYGWNAADTTRVARYGLSSAFGVSSIRNGYISGFKFAAVYLTGNSNQWVIQNMIIQSNNIGISAFASSYTRILTSSIHANAGTGISCGSYCHIEGNSVSSNGISGVSMNSGTVLGNSIFGNGSYGVSGNGRVGIGNNTIIDNNGGGQQVSGAVPLHPNVCQPVAC